MWIKSGGKDFSVVTFLSTTTFLYWIPSATFFHAGSAYTFADQRKAIIRHRTPPLHRRRAGIALSNHRTGFTSSTSPIGRRPASHALPLPPRGRFQPAHLRSRRCRGGYCERLPLSGGRLRYLSL